MHTMKDLNIYFDTNKKLWNNKLAVHVNSEFYDLQNFKKGKSSLNPVELRELGDVHDKTMLHLQCHFGMDSLSWGREGAIVTGIDFSDKAIDMAISLNSELNGNACFLCSNVYDLKQKLNQQFDIVFTSYGTIGWLPDLDKWADIIVHFLNPGGSFYMVDFHPVVWMFDNNFTYIRYSYFNQGPIVEELTGTYADRNADLKDLEYGWNHSISEILNALIRAGLKIEFFHEFSTSPYNCFKNMVETATGEWQDKRNGRQTANAILY